MAKAKVVEGSKVVELSESAFVEMMKTREEESTALAGPPDSKLVFLSQNNTLLTAHAGSTVELPCLIRREGQFGMVSIDNIDFENDP